jgi:hypothetical protein
VAGGSSKAKPEGAVPLEHGDVLPQARQPELAFSPAAPLASRPLDELPGRPACGLEGRCVKGIY